MQEITKVEDTEDLLASLEKKFFDIPFENSSFQNKNFVIQAQKTPARAYRAIGLKMFSKLNAIKELKFGRQLEDIDIEEHAYTISTSKDTFAVRRATVEIAKKLEGRGYTDKLLNDAIVELNFLLNELKKYPEYTRETFEAEEGTHFTAKLNSQIEARGQGALESLSNMSLGDSYDKILETTKRLSST